MKRFLGSRILSSNIRIKPLFDMHKNQTRGMCDRIYFGPGYGGNRKWNFLFWVFPITTFGLGTWQVFRWENKKKMIAEREGRVYSAPVLLQDHPDLLTANAADTVAKEDWAYRPVYVTGRFDHENEMYLYPRHYEGKAGFHIITPFIVSNSQKKILVNRGWVPLDKKDPESRVSGLNQNEQTIAGIIREKEKPGLFTPANKEGDNFWFFLDLDAMGSRTSSIPFLIDLKAEYEPTGGYPVPGTTVVKLPNNHVSYIITWYMLTAFLVAMVLRFNKDPRKAIEAARQAKLARKAERINKTEPPKE